MTRAASKTNSKQKRADIQETRKTREGNKRSEGKHNNIRMPGFFSSSMREEFLRSTVLLPDRKE